ncbi:MAG: Ig-like domain-containing protein, partial [Spirochaetaceae bacterium]|nr:Ig-like domain-containing protein [Spirochaetaceae bacterium]
MLRFFAAFVLVIFSVCCYAPEAQAQQDWQGMTIIGRMPDADSARLYRIQVGAFKRAQNAEQVYERLNRLSLNPAYEQYLDFTRVIVRNIKAGDITLYLERIRSAGFNEVIIREDTALSAPLPVSVAALPPGAAHEIAYCMLRAGETKSLAVLAEGRRIAAWTSSTPSVITVDSGGTVTGLAVGSGFVTINEREY